MTFKDLLDTLILDCDEDINDYEMMTRLKNYINRGYKELAKKERLEKVVDTDCQNNLIVKPLDLFEVLKIIENGIAVNFETRGNNIYINSNGDGTVTVIYGYIPKKLSKDTDILETNEVNSEFILAYAKYLYYLNDGLTEEAAIYKNEYESMQILADNNKIYKIENPIIW